MRRLRRILCLMLMLPLCPGLWAQEDAGHDKIVIESLLLRETPLSDAVQMLTMGGGMPIAVSRGAAQETISIYLDNITLEDALKTICSSHGLWYRRDPATGVTHLMTVQEFRAGINTYDEEIVEVVTIRYPRVEDVGESLQNVFQDRVHWVRPEDDREDSREDIQEALRRMDLMAQRATFQGSGPSGGSSGTSNTNPLDTTTDTTGQDRQNTSQRRPISPSPEDEEASTEWLTSILSAQDGRPTSLEELRRRPGVVTISAFSESNQLLLRGSDTQALARVKAVIESLDRPRPQVLLEVKVLDVLLDDEHARGVDWLFRDGPSGKGDRALAGWARGITDPVGQVIDPTNRANSLVPQGTGLDPRAALFNWVSDDIRARLQLLQDNNRVTQLATPNLLVADNEASQVFVGSEETVALDVEVTQNTDDDGNPTGPTTNQETERRRIGTMLLITPRIHADGTVTIRILQEESQVGEKETTVNGGFTRPVEERSVTTTAIASDGNILAIGGLVSERVAHRTRGVPVLQDIPLLGEFFKTTIQVQEHHELLVLVRPYVLLAPGDAQKVSRDFVDRISHHPAASGDKDLGVSARDKIPVGEDELKRRKAVQDVEAAARIWDVE